MDLQIVSERLHEWREARDWSQEETARRARLSPTTITHLENMHVARPQIGTVRKLAKAFGVSVGEFLEGVADDPKVIAPISPEEWLREQCRREKLLIDEQELEELLEHADARFLRQTVASLRREVAELGPKEAIKLTFNHELAGEEAAEAELRRPLWRLPLADA